MKKGKFYFSPFKFLLYIPFILYFLMLFVVLLNYFSAKKLRESALENLMEVQEEHFKKTIVDYINFHGMERDLSKLKNEFNQKTGLEKIYIINSYGLVVSSSEPRELRSQIQNSGIIKALKDGKSERISLRSKAGERRYLSVVPLKDNKRCFRCHEMKGENTGAMLLKFAIHDNYKKGIDSYLILLFLLTSCPLPFVSFFILKNKFIAPIRNFKRKRGKEFANFPEDGIKKNHKLCKFS